MTPAHSVRAALTHLLLCFIFVFLCHQDIAPTYRTSTLVLNMALFASTCLILLASAAVSMRIGDNWGTNIHWTAGQPGEAAMLGKAYKLARTDFLWNDIERTCGSYDFTAYDGLLKEMEAAGVRPYWIVDYSNDCYAPGVACNTTACIQAYGRFAYDGGA